MTRKSTSPQAMLLMDLGAEVVNGDYNVLSSLSAAFSGTDAVFCNTNFWDRMSLDEEIRQGVAAANAAAEEPSVKSFIYSTLPDGRKILGGEYQDNIICNAKAITLERIEAEYPELYKITTKLSIVFYHDNWVKYQLPFGPIKQGDGVFEMAVLYPSTNKIRNRIPR